MSLLKYVRLRVVRGLATSHRESETLMPIFLLPRSIPINLPLLCSEAENSLELEKTI